MQRKFTQIPLPHQVPEQQDFSSLPHEVLESMTVDTLVKQNQDLIARIAISLQRASEFEKRIQLLSSENQTLVKENDFLSDEASRLKKIDLMYQADLQKVINQRSEVEMQYADLFSKHLESTKAKDFLLTKLSEQVSRHQKYRRNIKKTYLALFQEMKQKVENQNFTLSKLHASYSEKEIEIQTLKKRLFEAYDQVGKMSSTHRTALSETVTRYESQIQELQKRLQEAINSYLQATGQNGELNGVHERLVVAENQLIESERSCQDLRNQLTLLENSLDAIKNKNKQLADQLQLSIDKFETHQNDNSLLKEQVFALQASLQSQQALNQKDKLQEASYQRLNQELSVQVNQLRKENELLRSQIQTSIPHSENHSQPTSGEQMGQLNFIEEKSQNAFLINREEALNKIEGLLNKLEVSL